MIEQQALEHIENLTLNIDELGLKRPLTMSEQRQVLVTVDEIYKTAHSANKSHSCYDVHKDWRKIYTK